MTEVKKEVKKKRKDLFNSTKSKLEGYEEVQVKHEQSLMIAESVQQNKAQETTNRLSVLNAGGN